MQTATQAFNEAVRLQGEGDMPKALVCFRRAASLDSSDARYEIALGVCLLQLRHWDEAVKALSRGIELKPHYAEADARLYLAEALTNAGDLARAQEQLKLVASMEPSYPSYDKPMAEAKKRLVSLGAR
jgi:tetratricopeptide (TPR) repeat protein